jgi:hypothetical protein
MCCTVSVFVTPLVVVLADLAVMRMYSMHD